MNKRGIYLKYDERIFKMLDEIVEEETKDGKADLHWGKYGVASAIKQGIVFAHALLVTKDFELIPNRELIEEYKKRKSVTDKKVI